jgi:hypothetical protein
LIFLPEKKQLEESQWHMKEGGDEAEVPRRSMYQSSSPKGRSQTTEKAKVQFIASVKQTVVFHGPLLVTGMELPFHTGGVFSIRHQMHRCDHISVSGGQAMSPSALPTHLPNLQRKDKVHVL